MDWICETMHTSSCPCQEKRNRQSHTIEVPSIVSSGEKETNNYLPFHLNQRTERNVSPIILESSASVLQTFRWLTPKKRKCRSRNDLFFLFDHGERMIFCCSWCSTFLFSLRDSQSNTNSEKLLFLFFFFDWK